LLEQFRQLPARGGFLAGPAEHGVQLIHGSERLDPGIVLANARSGKQAGFALVARLGVDLHPVTLELAEPSGIFP
jgi:hypothetical protein